jgi:NADP-dependent 3-hydroxy acid dehydrogenase YdfG
MDLQGKTAIITGASSGIGEVTALKLANAGVKVVLMARRGDRLRKLGDKIMADGGDALIIEGDVTSKVSCNEVVDQTVLKWKKIDILVNNAGVMLLGETSDAPLEEWEQMVHVNLLGLLYMTYAALPVMREQLSGHLVNISSVAGRTTNPGSAVYNATKWGVNAFTDALRQELAGGHTNIRTTLVEPGAVGTELISHNRPEVQDMLRESQKGTTKRLESEDIAAAIIYAVSQPLHVSVNEILIRPTDQAR